MTSKVMNKTCTERKSKEMKPSVLRENQDILSRIFDHVNYSDIEWLGVNSEQVKMIS